MRFPLFQRRQYVRVEVAGKVAVHVAVMPDDPLQGFERRGFAVLIHKGKQGVDKLADAGVRVTDFITKVVQNGFDRLGVLLRGHEGRQPLTRVGEQNVMDKTDIAGGPFNIRHNRANHTLSSCRKRISHSNKNSSPSR